LNIFRESSSPPAAAPAGDSTAARPSGRGAAGAPSAFQAAEQQQQPWRLSSPEAAAVSEPPLQRSGSRRVGVLRVSEVDGAEAVAATLGASSSGPASPPAVVQARHVGTRSMSLM
jgi:hypothetical protein